MNGATLADLKARALDYADMTGSDFVDDDRLRDYINAGLAELHDVIVEASEDYYRKTQSITLASGTETYALPTDYLKTLKMFYVSGDRRYRLARFDLNELDGYKTSPIQAGTVEHWYIPQHALLENDADVVDPSIARGWEDFAALAAAVRIVVKKDTDPSALFALMDRAKARIVAAVTPRDQGEPEHISDAYGRWGGGFDGVHEDKAVRYRVMGQYIHFHQFENLGV